MDLEARVVVITGASAGLGAGMAAWFAAAGASLGLCARTEPAPPSGRSLTRSVDVTDFPGLQAFAADVSAGLGPIDLWINNAAVLEPVVFQRDLSAEQLASHLAINVGGVLNGTRAFLGRLAADNHRGALVNMSSGLAGKGMAGVGAYSAAKAGVDRLTEVVGLEEPELLTMALSVSPGLVDTSMQQSLRQQDPAVLPNVDMFRRRKREGSMNSPVWVAQNIAGWVFGAVDPGGVVVRVPDQS